MKLYALLIGLGCIVNTAVAAQVSCGPTNWQYKPNFFTVANHSQAYQIHLQQIKCYDYNKGEVELIYSSQPIRYLEKSDYIKAQKLYRSIGGQMNLQGDIIFESFYQPASIKAYPNSIQSGQLRIKVGLANSPFCYGPGKYICPVIV